MAVAPPAGPGPTMGTAEGRGAALEAVVCVPLPLPLQLGAGRGALAEGAPPTLLQGPPLLILASSGYDALGGLQLDVRGDEVPCAQLEEAGAIPPPPLDSHLPKTGTRVGRVEGEWEAGGGRGTGRIGAGESWVGLGQGSRGSGAGGVGMRGAVVPHSLWCRQRRRRRCWG